MNQSELLALLNNAGRHALIELPGVGPVLAERIIAARPYDSLDAVPAVKGVSSDLIERWMAAASTPQPDPESAPNRPEDDLVPEIGGTDAPAAPSALEGVKGAIVQSGKFVGGKITGWRGSVRRQGRAAQRATEAPPEKLEPATRSRGSLKTIVLSSALSALVAIVLTLAILGGVNGSLKFSTASQYRASQNEVSSLTARVDALRQDLDGLRGQVDVLQGLGERIVVLESAQQRLTADYETVGQQVSDMQTQVTALNSKVEQQEGRTQRFETFLKDLQTLLGGLFTQGATQ